MNYIATKERYGSTEHYFCPALIAADLAFAMTKETGEAWTYRIDQDTDMSFDWKAVSLIRVRDGLAIWVQREAYNRPCRGAASVSWRESGCSLYGDPGDQRTATFDPNRPLATIARQIVNKVILPTAAAVERRRATERSHNDKTQSVAAALRRLANEPGAKVSTGNGSGSAYVTVGPFSFRVSEYGSITVDHFSNIGIDGLFDLAEFYQSMKRQTGAQE